MSDTNTDYKLLIQGTLLQKTAFSTGGNRQETDVNADTDNLLAKDGEGRFTLRGSSLAGAFIATARSLYNDISEQISEDTPQEQQNNLQEKLNKHNASKEEDLPRMQESVWIYHHAHPLDFNLQVEIRDNVAIRQKTGATKEGAKFDVEILPAGTRWNFLMEVDEYRDHTPDKNASSIALNVIEEWKKQCWLGRDVARGLGWMELTEVKIYRLTTAHVAKWPDSEKYPYELLQGLSGTLLDDEAVTEIKNIKPPQKTIRYLGGTITLTVGVNDDGYGLDMLSVGGNNPGKGQEDRKVDYPANLRGKAFLKKHKDKLLSPLGQKIDNYVEFPDSNTNDADFSLALTQTADAKVIPHIPGSSIRGSLRHTLSWLLRKQDKPVWEPGGENNYPENEDIVLKLFGSTQKSASLLISDALLVDDDNWQMVVLEMHAEDEFTQGVFDKSKFDRACMTQGTFKADYYLETTDEGEDSEFNQMKEQIETLKTLGKQQMIPIGGGQWKGLGWIKLDITVDDGIGNGIDDDREAEQND